MQSSSSAQPFTLDLTGARPVPVATLGGTERKEAIMSTYYKPYPGLGPKFELMQFAGGENRGLCLQITPRNERGGLGPIQLTKSDAINLRAALLDWLDGKLTGANL
jgi:hypothetical protein